MSVHRLGKPFTDGRARRRAFGAALALAGCLIGAWAFTPPASAEPQSAPPADSAHVDHKRLTGTWDRYPSRDDKLDPRYTALVQATAPPLKPRFQAEYVARQKAAHEADLRGQPLYGGYAKCLPDGMPAMMMAMFPLEVLQTPGQITIIEEAYNQVRRIYLDEKQIAIADAEPGFWGHSVGRWEGDTLVVNTVGIKDYVRFRDVPHSDKMQIDERIRLLSPEMFRDDIVITDPEYLTEPWRFTWMYKRRPGYKMLEYVCESNREYQDPQTGGIRMRMDSAAPKPADAAPKPPGDAPQP